MIKARRVILLSVLAALLMMLSPVKARSSTPNRVALVIRFGDGSTHTQCIEFNEPQISGLDVLMRSGLNIVYQPSGSMAAVCKIQDDGCNYPAQPCFCQCSDGSSCLYWSYWHLKDGAWQYSQLGASSYMVSNGDIEGWVWGIGSPASAPQPPMVDFNSICAPPPTTTPLPTDTSLPTDTPTAPPTATPVPPASVSFTVEPEQITAGECATLRWDVEHAQAVFLDGEGVVSHDSQQVCPTQTQSYELRVVSAFGETRHTVTVSVLQPLATPTGTPVPIAPTPTPPAATATRSATRLPPTSTPIPPTPTPLPLTDTPAPTATILAALPLTATPISTSTLSPTPQQVAVISPAQPSATLGATPLAERVTGKGGARELLGWVAIVGVLLAFLIYVLWRREPRPNDSA